MSISAKVMLRQMRRSRGSHSATRVLSTSLRFLDTKDPRPGSEVLQGNLHLHGLDAEPFRRYASAQTTIPSAQHVSLSSWLRALWMGMDPKVPKGFENFFPKGTPQAKETEKNKKEAPKSSFQEKQKQRRRGGVPPPGDNDPNSITSMIALLLLVLAARRFLTDEDGEGSRNGKEITFVQFQNELLDAGQVEKIEVVNNEMARVLLHPGSPGLSSKSLGSRSALGGFGSDTTASTMMTDAPSDATTMDFGSTSFGMDPSSGGGLSRDGRSSTGGHGAPTYHFYIGSVESFEEKLSKAQHNVNPRDWVPVQYVNEVNLFMEFIKATPMLATVAILYYFSRGLMGGAGGAGGAGGPGGIFQIGKSNAKKINPESVTVNFGDVAGCTQAKTEVMEFVDFLKDSSRFTKLGAKIPKGALLCGPPGTGKTLLAKAVAGEAGVPFFSISGSDFIEMFVGVGPARVRDLFKEARNNSPCIVFIDEIDAVGRQRGRGGFSGGNDERENTLNQLLVEMDGFSPTTGVVVLAGTNRADILDQALTRPGRFDRQITVDIPDLQGRQEIFQVHLKNITLDGDIKEFSGRLAGLTPGFAGADIANLCNEAAIVAARRKAETVSFADFEKATDRIIGGLESHKIMSDHEREIVAHHEAGHAVAGWFLEHADPLLKVTIIPRTSGALGFAQYLPKEVFLRTQDQIMDIVCMALAGRAAEEVFFGRVTTGASDDLRRVTDMIYSTIQTYGMSSRIGQLAFNKQENGMPGDKPYSEATAEAMDEEARALVESAYQRTVDLIREHKDDVEKVAKLLIEKETITHDDIIDTVGPRPFKGNPAYDEFVSWRQKERQQSQSEEEIAESDDAKSEEPPEEPRNLQPGLA